MVVSFGLNTIKPKHNACTFPYKNKITPKISIKKILLWMCRRLSMYFPPLTYYTLVCGNGLLSSTYLETVLCNRLRKTDNHLSAYRNQYVMLKQYWLKSVTFFFSGCSRFPLSLWMVLYYMPNALLSITVNNTYWVHLKYLSVFYFSICKTDTFNVFVFGTGHAFFFNKKLKETFSGSTSTISLTDYGMYFT